MKTKKYYVKPNVHVVEIDNCDIIATSGDGEGTPGAGTDTMPGEQ